KAPLLDGEGKPYALCGIATDITEWKRMQEQLRQSQKMEAIGRLAGGVAHDFNNLLSVIIGFTEFLQSGLGGKPQQMEHVEQIARAAQQAAALTRKLLTFSRRQMPQHQVLDLNVVLHDLEKMLRCVVNEDIEMTIQTASAPGLVRSDRGQIEQAILNLVINARDAMPNGGKLILATDAVNLDKDF